MKQTQSDIALAIMLHQQNIYLFDNSNCNKMT